MKALRTSSEFLSTEVKALQASNEAAARVSQILSQDTISALVRLHSASGLFLLLISCRKS